MYKYTPEMLIEGLVDHPYETNPHYTARINFFDFSPDKKLATYYWEAPAGEVLIRYTQFDEMIIVQSGLLEIRSAAGNEIFRAGDCLQISRHDGDLVFHILQKVKAVGYVYPIDEKELANITALMKG